MAHFQMYLELLKNRPIVQPTILLKEVIKSLSIHIKWPTASYSVWDPINLSKCPNILGRHQAYKSKKIMVILITYNVSDASTQWHESLFQISKSITPLMNRHIPPLK